MSVSGFGGILDMTYDEAEPLEIVVIEMRVTVSNTLAQESLRMSVITSTALDYFSYLELLTKDLASVRAGGSVGCR